MDKKIYIHSLLAALLAGSKQFGDCHWCSDGSCLEQKVHLNFNLGL